jgi:branched-subunit amino acid ABC-type transport system permease component
MNEVLLFALLGFGSAAVYTLLASGIIVAFKGTGVINFSQGAIATNAAYTFISLRTNLGTPLGRFVQVNGSSGVLPYQTPNVRVVRIPRWMRGYADSERDVVNVRPHG